MSYAAEPDRPRRPRLLRAAAAGLLAGAAIGVVDGLWTLGRATQYLAGAGGALRFLAYLAAAYAGLGIALATLFALLGAALAGTPPAALARRLVRREGARSLAPLALTLAAIPALGGALGLGYVVAVRELATRKHIGLVIGAAMAIGIAAAVVGAIAAALLARALERGLRASHRLPALHRALTAPLAPLIAALALLAVAGAIAAALWPVVAQLPLRAPLVLALLPVLLLPAHARVAALTDRLAGRPLRARAAIALAALFAVVAATLAAGASPAVHKAAARGSGLGAPIAAAYRAAIDLDRDGASPILAGGDCDDGDRAVGPAMPEIPDDGRDNNCIGGDVTSGAPHDPGFAAVPPSVPADFDVLLVTIDTLRADHVGAYGYARPTTPALDALAADGALFVNGWAHAPSTRYSIPAILTGRLPLAVDYDEIRGQWPGLSLSNTLIAEVLQARGLATAAVTNYWYFDKVRKMDQGFERYDNSNKRLHAAIPGEGPARTRGSSSKEQTDKAIELLGQLGDRRAFLWVHYYDPHADYERHSGQFGDGVIDRYDDEIRYTDDQIGRLFAELRRRGRWDRTVVIVTGDHGEGFGEHGIDFHGYHLYAAQTKVPLIVRVPGVAPSRPTFPAGHVDILPTLANLAGAAPAATMDGVSLLPAILGGPAATADRAVFQQLSYEGNHELRAAASQRCHVIYNVSPAQSFEVYRLDEDPLERRDRVADPGPCAEVLDQLTAWYDRSQIPVGAAEALLPAAPSLARPLDVELDGGVRLLAVDLPSTEVRAGERFDVTYTFAAGAAQEPGWKVFVHFDGPRGFKDDHQPTRPLAWWRAGQFIRYTRSVAVPAGTPPGAYPVFVGLFRKDERRRARSAVTRVENDRAAVGAIRVGR